MHEALTASVPQLFVWLKSPLAETAEIVAEVVPVLVTVVDWLAAEFPTTVPGKASAAGLALRVGPDAVPLPERATVPATPPATLTASVAGRRCSASPSG